MDEDSDNNNKLNYLKVLGEMAEPLDKHIGTSYVQEKAPEPTWKDKLAEFIKLGGGENNSLLTDKEAMGKKLDTTFNNYTEMPTRMVRSGAQLISGEPASALDAIRKPLAQSPTVGDIAQKKLGLQNPYLLTGLDVAENLVTPEMAGKGATVNNVHYLPNAAIKAEEAIVPRVADNMIRKGGSVNLRAEKNIPEGQKIIQMLSKGEDTLAGTKGMSNISGIRGNRIPVEARTEIGSQFQSKLKDYANMGPEEKLELTKQVLQSLANRQPR